MNQDDAVSETAQPPQTKSSWRRWVKTSTLFLICAGIIWFLMPVPVLPPQATLLPADYSIKPVPLPIPDRWIPLKWGWLWRFRALFGRLAVIDVNARIVRLAHASSPELSAALSKHPPLVETNGVRAWILPESELGTLRQLLEGIKGCETVSAPRITSGLTVQANLSFTTTVAIGGAQVPVGVSVNCLTLARGKTANLTVVITQSEAVTESRASVAATVLGNAVRIHTNLTLAANLRLPPGNGAFLLDTNRADSQGRHVGVFISSQVK